MLCERCSGEHDGSFGSGRFCSRSCANGKGTPRSKDVRLKISASLSHPPRPAIKCKECNCEFIPKKKNQLLCSRICARRNNIKIASIEQQKNPPNWSEIHKRAYSLGNNFIAGGTTPWIDYKDIRVQGTYELRMCKILDRMIEVGDIKDWYYSKDRVKYKGIDGIYRTYIIDFKVINNDDSYYYIETKGYVRENDEQKWAAVRNRGDILIVVFNEDLIKYEARYKIPL